MFYEFFDFSPINERLKSYNLPIEHVLSIDLDRICVKGVNRLFEPRMVIINLDKAWRDYYALVRVDV